MVTGSEGATESGTRLTIIHITVSKEDARLSREALAYMNRLAHEATIHLITIDDTGSSSHHTVLDDDIRTDECACIIRTEDGAIGQFTTPLHLTSLANLHIVHLLHIHDARP